MPFDTPILRADDLGALRGDGIFETMHVRQGRPWLLDEHLRRMSGSAELLQLALPSRDALAELAEQALAGWDTDVEGALRLVCTRGVEAGGSPTVYATLAPVAAAHLRTRIEGIAVVTASLGLDVAARSGAPWLLGGAKTLSYAINMASQRWAVTQGVDDVLWTSADGYVLEAPTSTVIWLTERTLWTVPVAATGILAGTTARWLLDHAGELGFTAGERLIRPEELTAAAGIWLVSSIRGAAEVRSIDGASRKPAEDTDRILSLLGFPR